jgi:phosphate starvation-inducible PhoH-like protein
MHLSRQRGAKAQIQKKIMVENTIPFDQQPRQRQRPIELIPKSRNQENLILNLLNQDQSIVVAVGPAGTGKTYLAMLAAVRAFRSGEAKRIILTRPAIGVEDEQHGFLPGNLVAKMEPWTDRKSVV